MADGDANVRACAVRLARRWLLANQALRARLYELAAAEPIDRVRFEVALALGDVINDAASVAPLAQIATSDRADEWTRRGVATSVGHNGSAVLARIVDGLDKSQSISSEADAALVGELAEVVGAAPEADAAEIGLRSLGKLIEPVAGKQSDARKTGSLLAGVDGLARGARRRGHSLGRLTVGLGNAALTRLVTIATRVAEHGTWPAQRRNAIEVLRLTSARSKAPAVLIQLAVGESDTSVRLAALSALSSFSDPTIAKTVLVNFFAESPAIRRAILDVLLSDTNRTRLLLSELETRRISVTELDPTRMAQLVHFRDADVRKRAGVLLARQFRPIAGK